MISTIIPVFNRASMVRDAVTSVLNQTHQAIELILVDDGSTDDTPQVLAALAKQHATIRVVSQGNQGPGSARDTGLRHAQGEFIQYLDSDDLLEPRKFELQVQALREHPDAGVCYCVTLRGDPDRPATLQTWARTAERIENIFPEFLMKRGWATLTPLWRRSVCDKIGPWGNFRVMEDWEHDLRAGMLGVKPVHVAEPLAIVRDHDGNRASGLDTGFTPELTREFFRAHRSICQKMFERDLLDCSYLEQFSRKIFWIARMCGGRGLMDEAEEALEIAERMVATLHPPREINRFRRLVRLLGWRRAVRWSEAGRKLMRPHKGWPAL